MADQSKTSSTVVVDGMTTYIVTADCMDEVTRMLKALCFREEQMVFGARGPESKVQKLTRLIREALAVKDIDSAKILQGQLDDMLGVKNAGMAKPTEGAPVEVEVAKRPEEIIEKSEPEPDGFSSTATDWSKVPVGAAVEVARDGGVVQGVFIAALSAPSDGMLRVSIPGDENADALFPRAFVRIDAKNFKSEGLVQVTDAARKMAADEHIDLRQVKGTGKGGKIVEGDVMRALRNRPAEPAVVEEAIA